MCFGNSYFAKNSAGEVIGVVKNNKKNKQNWNEQKKKKKTKIEF